MTGLFDANMRSVTVPPPSRRNSESDFVDNCPSLNVSAPAERSAPAQKARPAPVTMTARTPSSASIRSNAAMSSFIIVLVNAFSLSGRLSVIVATRSSTSYAIALNC